MSTCMNLAFLIAPHVTIPGADTFCVPILQQPFVFPFCNNVGYGFDFDAGFTGAIFR